MGTAAPGWVGTQAAELCLRLQVKLLGLLGALGPAQTTPISSQQF